MYSQPWLDIVTFLTRKLGMTLSSKTPKHETYRKQLKDHIVTVEIKTDSFVDGPYFSTNLTIDGANIWWHILPYHSGYTLESLDDFNNVEFVRTIIRNSIEFYNDWKSNADI